LIHAAQQHEGKQRFMKVVTELSQAFALCAATDDATAIRDDVAFCQAVRSALARRAVAPGGRPISSTPPFASSCRRRSLPTAR
jgi:hypothetical protein